MHRLAVDNDIPALVTLKYKMFEEIDMAHLLVDDFISEVTEDYRKLYSLGMAQHFVIEHDGRITACAGAFIKDDIPYRYFKERQYGFIGDVYVHPEFRKRGYARTLTNAALHWFAERDVKTIRLLASQNARPLYASLGFIGTDEMVLHR
ncbi:GNAT family N-acetyltransferase [Fodinisporobacter ferrooxydans]|uniref:GNAT family N-acetyltransferase n=1 Tax=Fodinisporobacter ferrooxydans TaxID=2901836 RepID=A0ABY4CHP3_9BACL|nr:GNAT family N-acetyltransferase [Alicyclobacillaceae bacterium MYW30-H2]